MKMVSFLSIICILVGLGYFIGQPSHSSKSTSTAENNELRAKAEDSQKTKATSDEDNIASHVSKNSPLDKVTKTSGNNSTEPRLDSLPRRAQGDKLRGIIDNRAVEQLTWLNLQDIPKHPWVRAAYIEALGELGALSSDSSIVSETVSKLNEVINFSLDQDDGESLSSINSSIEALGKIDHESARESLESTMLDQNQNLLQQYLATQALANFSKVESAESIKVFYSRLEQIDPSSLLEHERPLLDEALTETQKLLKSVD